MEDISILLIVVPIAVFVVAVIGSLFEGRYKERHKDDWMHKEYHIG